MQLFQKKNLLNQLYVYFCVTSTMKSPQIYFDNFVQIYRCILIMQICIFCSEILLELLPKQISFRKMDMLGSSWPFVQMGGGSRGGGRKGVGSATFMTSCLLACTLSFPKKETTLNGKFFLPRSKFFPFQNRPLFCRNVSVLLKHIQSATPQEVCCVMLKLVSFRT